ncbi:uncharacterized protein [Anabrus simplex]|uniref:uncharacterized protein isoform X2 n=1 Tax=Anabrus simplex TaxID=316456 RepID=UPI0035A385A7
MAQFTRENEDTIPWMDEGEWVSTEIPSIDGEAGNSMAVLAAVIVGVLAAITLLFSLALLIDCRNKKLAASQSPPKKKLTIGKLPNFFNNSSANGDGISFANKMCTENGMTLPPELPENGIC